ncbi:MAG TPA: hypothetical protein VIM29_11795 [Bacillota bacterium]
MKHKTFIIGEVILLLFWLMPVYGADVLYRLTHNCQDALIIGKISSQQGQNFKIEVERVISGRLKVQSLFLNSDFEYSLLFTKPQIGDVCVASLQRSGPGYRIRWGVYKVASLDKKLIFEKVGLSEGLKADLTALEWYINSNGKATEFYFDGTDGVQAYLRLENGKSLRIYPVPEQALETVFPAEH